MPDDINQDQQAIINDEVLRSRIRDLIKNVLKRMDFFVAQMDKNNWDLLPPFQVGERTIAAVP